MGSIPGQPRTVRAIAFVDGQNLFHSAKDAFGYRDPNFDISALSHAIVSQYNWSLIEVRFYTGVPRKDKSLKWHQFWSNKLRTMNKEGIETFSRQLTYQTNVVTLAGGARHGFVTGIEKGIDVRLALDFVKAVSNKRCDAAVIFSQDQDLSEAVDDAKEIVRAEGRWFRIVSSYPANPGRKTRGIDGTDWHPFDKALYDVCLDTRNFFSG